MAQSQKDTQEKTPNPKSTVANTVVAKPQKQRFDWSSLNTLSVVSLAAAASGVGSLVAVITGHIGLAQLKTSGENGRKLALIGVVLGYVQLAAILLFSILAVVAQVALLNMLGSEPGMWMEINELRNGMRFDWD